MIIYTKRDPNLGICDTSGYETDKNNNNLSSFGTRVPIMMQTISQNTSQLHIIESKDLDMYKTKSASLNTIKNHPFPGPVHCEGVLLRSMTSS